MRSYFLCLGLWTAAVLTAHAALPPAPIQIRIRAWPDGLSNLTLRANTAQWFHKDFAAPGRHYDYYPDFKPTTINGVDWYPTWPDNSPAPYQYENRGCYCYSSTFYGVFPRLPSERYLVAVNPITIPEGGTVRIVDYPWANNDFEVTLEFNDDVPIGPHLYEVDLLVYPPVTAVTIDIRPGNPNNIVNPKSQGVIQVAILSTPTFDAPAQVDPTFLTFGPTGDERSFDRCLPANQDVNHDGLPDLVCQFRAFGFHPGDTAGILKGSTRTNHFIMGSDSVSIVP